MQTMLVTGVAGFIGFHLAAALSARGVKVIGIDNLNDYYSVQLKRDRLTELAHSPNVSFVELDLTDRNGMQELFAKNSFDCVFHLAAQAGVRYSIENPQAYIDANLVGFGNILESCRHNSIGHLIYASSSSVYGANRKLPFSVHDNVDHPLSLYAATKKANELMAHTYSHLYRLPTTGLRFFTVYGPWGRPDMALYKFTKAIFDRQPIDVYNSGQMQRDFTYIDDIVESMIRLCDHIPQPSPDWSGHNPDPGASDAPYRVYNIGNNQPIPLDRFIAAIELATGINAERRLLPMQPGDVPATFADVADLEKAVGFRPNTTIEDGVAKFVEWYRAYHQI